MSPLGGRCNRKEKNMSRFVLIGAHACVANGLYQKLHSGQKVADSTANALAGDAIAPSLCAKPTRDMAPLDSAAVNAHLAMGIVSTIGMAMPAATGVGSIDA
jgi:hypothetical protein